MKCIALFSFIILTLFIVLGAGGTATNAITANDYLRIHIRANSNETEDQVVKYAVKNKVVEVVTPLIANCSSKVEMAAVLELNKEQIETYCNQVLKEHSFYYESKMSLKREYFPTRMYDDVVLENGMYDAIIVELGEAEGNNWWCVVYPPLCFVNDTANQNIIYKSKLLELIKKFFK